MTTVYYAYKQKDVSKEMLEFVLSTYYGISDFDNLFAISENGKPYLTGNPVYFNVTHTNGLIMIAVSSSPVGIDAENVIEKKVDFVAVSEKYYSLDERKNLSSMKQFLILWTKKESIIKFKGETLARKLKTTTVLNDVPVMDGKPLNAKTVTFSWDDFVWSVTGDTDGLKTLFIM